MSGAAEAFALMMANPPDPNEHLPTSNHVSTAYAVAIPFHVLAWAAVLFRLYTRFKLLRQPWWDDYTIMLALVLNLVATVTYIGSMKNGSMGLRTLLVSDKMIMISYKWAYVNQWAYAGTIVVSKISLLLQYLRLFERGLVYSACKGLLVAVSIWGFIFVFMSTVPCFPIEGYWNFAVTAKCYGLGFSDYESLRITLIVFPSLDMLFSILIYFLPLTMYLKSGLTSRQVLALIILFVSGSTVIITSVLRLWVVVEDTDTPLKNADYLWWYPAIMLISSLELNFALITASVPVFHGYFVKYLAAIFVTREVIVQRHERMSNSGPDYEMERPSSWKSNNSEERLTRKGGRKTNYSDPSVIDHVRGEIPENTRIEVELAPPISRWKAFHDA